MDIKRILAVFVFCCLFACKKEDKQKEEKIVLPEGKYNLDSYSLGGRPQFGETFYVKGNNFYCRKNLWPYEDSICFDRVAGVVFEENGEIKIPNLEIYDSYVCSFYSDRYGKDTFLFHLSEIKKCDKTPFSACYTGNVTYFFPMQKWNSDSCTFRGTFELYKY
ncbi:MAG: hypothetical protein CFE21_02160 [Bacteroidetes bacterium B1(2017)]|nr:MAG: hypothetical protein CFE21_02160 [Bacteroidetes bacterium B1(2017)]